MFTFQQRDYERQMCRNAEGWGATNRSAKMLRGFATTTVLAEMATVTATAKNKQIEWMNVEHCCYFCW